MAQSVSQAAVHILTNGNTCYGCTNLVKLATSDGIHTSENSDSFSRVSYFYCSNSKECLRIVSSTENPDHVARLCPKFRNRKHGFYTYIPFTFSHKKKYDRNKILTFYNLIKDSTVHPKQRPSYEKSLSNIVFDMLEGQKRGKTTNVE